MVGCIKFFKIKAGAQLKPVYGRFKPRLKFFIFGLWWHWPVEEKIARQLREVEAELSSWALYFKPDNTQKPYSSTPTQDRDLENC